MKKDDALEINPPALAIRLAEYGVNPPPDFASMPMEEVQRYFQENGIQVTEKHRKQFTGILEKVRAQLRFEEAKDKLANRKSVAEMMTSVTARIASLTKSDLIAELRERLTSPGVSSEVYARNLEDTPEDDLRSLLVDLERAKHTGDKTEYNKGPGDGV